MGSPDNTENPPLPAATPTTDNPVEAKNQEAVAELTPVTVEETSTDL